jgi:hypothetical protein
MNNKPLKQTILDTIYFLRKKDVTNFYLLSVLNIDSIYGSDITIFIDKSEYITRLDYNQQINPGLYSYYNYNVDYDNKCMLAHLWGLYYEGMIHDINHYDITNDSITIDKIMVLFPLNFIYVNYSESHDKKYDNKKYDNKKYYHLDADEPYIIPTTFSYISLLIKQIKKYQDLININYIAIKKIVTDIINGANTDISDLYTKLFPQLDIYCKILNNFINSFNRYELDPSLQAFENPQTFKINELIEKINKMNSNYYLYYYLFAETKLIKLSKFSFYQIPIDKPTGRLFFNGTEGYKISDITNDNKSIIDESTLVVTPEPANKNRGFMSNSIHYLSILNEYKQNNYTTSLKTDENSFIIAKESKLPPSLYNTLNDFYKYALIEITKKVLISIKYDTEIYTKVKEINDKPLVIYNILCKFINEIIKSDVEYYINSAIGGITKINEVNNNNNNINRNINIDLSKINLNDYTKLNQIKNIYSTVSPLPKSDVFILYPNDLTNLNKFKGKYGIKVNNKIINILLSYYANPYIYNNDEASCIYSIMKNYNYNMIKEMIDSGIDFRNYEKEKPYTFIQNENINNIDKILHKIPTIENILSNIDSYLYNDVKSVILSNEAFGNNLLIYLPESFHITTYLTLQYLSEHLTNIDDTFTFEELEEVLKLIDVKIEDMNKNYLNENIKEYEIPGDIKNLIIKLILKDKKAELKQVDKERKHKKIKDITKYGDIKNRILESSKYKNLEEKHYQLNGEIIALEEHILKNFEIILNVSDPNPKIIKRYEVYKDYGLMVYAWQKLFEEKELNYNLAVIKLLMKQKENNIHIDSANNHLSNLCEYYFNTPKYTESNYVLRYIKDMLEYTTKLVIGNGIEIMMKRILFEFYNTSDEIEKTNQKIDYILADMITKLYDNVCPKLVEIAAEIYADKSEELNGNNQTVRSVLSDFFDLLENSPIPLTDEIKLIFKKDILNYFDLIASKSILLWYVNVENIFKFIINNHRCYKTLINLSN